MRHWARIRYWSKQSAKVEGEGKEEPGDQWAYRAKFN